MSRKRASQAELVARRQEIQELILQGHSSSFIVETMTKKYKTTPRAIKEDIKIIGKDWQERAPEDAQLMRNKYQERLELLFNEAVGKGHIKVALEVQKEIHKLNGIYKEKEQLEDNIPKIINVKKRTELKVVSDDNE